MDSLSFGVIRAGLGVKLEYDGYPKPKEIGEMLCLIRYVWTYTILVFADCKQSGIAINCKSCKSYSLKHLVLINVGYTLVSSLAPKPSLDSCALKDAVLAMFWETIDISGLHCGKEVIPVAVLLIHICFHPLAQSSFEPGSWDCEVSGSSRLALVFKSQHFYMELPMFEGPRTLVFKFRRELAIFWKPNGQVGPIQRSLPLKPDGGPAEVNQAKATRWVDNFTISLSSPLILLSQWHLNIGNDVIEVAYVTCWNQSTVGRRDVVSARSCETRGGGGLWLWGKRDNFTDFSQDKIIEKLLEVVFASETIKRNLSASAESCYLHPRRTTSDMITSELGETTSFNTRNRAKAIKIILSRWQEMNKKTANESMLICCMLFISEARNRAALDLIEQAARIDSESVIVNKFEDRVYNRIRFTIVSYVVVDSTGSPIYSPLHQTVLAIVEAAYGAINLELHSGAHPRLGVVDDIAFHPLAEASLDEAAWLAKAVAADIGSRFQVPVFLYAAAHPTGRAPDTIRRELGYYRPNFMGSQWAGWNIPEILQKILTMVQTMCLGPEESH
ncbi:LOW QUALITY PROTEIN: hypothetical protein NC652_032064 [Populus alba x Populus x berolinensis]|nr:LOW QUALITY PROTEIN: hypothetical protein NC652_032064 [Populus alba x Populus x berolinensis]